MSNNESSSSSSSGIETIGLLGVAFVILKLCGVIGWSWWWVTVPFWGGFAIVAAVLLLIVAVMLAGLLVWGAFMALKILTGGNDGK